MNFLSPEPNNPGSPQTNQALQPPAPAISPSSSMDREGGYEAVPDHQTLPFHLSLLVSPTFPATRLAALHANHRRKSDLASHLMATGAIGEDLYFRLAAKRLGLHFVETLPSEGLAIAEPVPLDELADIDKVVAKPSLSFEGLPPVPHQTLITAPRGEALDLLAEKLNAMPELRDRVYLTTPGALRSSLRRQQAPRAFAEQVYALKDHLPHLSAHRSLSRGKAVAIALLIPLMALFLLSLPGLPIALNIIGVGLFLSVAVLRFFAWRQQGQVPSPDLTNHQHIEPEHAIHAGIDAVDWPSYSVLIPLYREAAIVPDLIKAMKQLDYPRDRLRIMVLIEEDDDETWAAFADLHLPNHFDCVSIPNEGPRTKPKALNYALAYVSSDLVVIYDAEDRPAPRQLKEAARRMMAAGDDLACLQGRLAIDNGHSSWLSHQFSIEYSALFDGLLPFLAKAGLPVPLGGTSNHFRTPILKKVGGWDPYNVTEDADLGLRLFRFGYRIEMLRSDTQEEAPERYGSWLKQRTRWFKGWMKTWLVHMQSPRILWQEMGLKGFLTFQILIGGMLISALIHPIFLLGLLYSTLAITSGYGQDNMLFWLLLHLDGANLLLGYGFAMLLAFICAKQRFGYGLSSVLQLPLYWLVMTPAAWRALYQILFDPHRWEKTEHGLSKGRPSLEKPDRP